MPRPSRFLAALLALVAAASLLAACGSDDADTASAAAIPFTAATVATDGTAFDVQWAAPEGAGTVTVYAGEDPDAVGRARKVGTGDSTDSVRVADLPGAPRWYFELVPEDGEPLVVADRSLHLASMPNLRDIGGYRTADGHWVRMGRLYRSDGLDKLSDADYQALQALDIKLVCDLRTEGERAKGPDRLPAGAEGAVFDVAADAGDATAVITEAITSGDTAKQEELLGDGKGAQLMVDGGRSFVTLASAKTAYTAMFDRFADPASYPALLHCTAGKDRTGWATATVLSALGVPRRTVMADYLLSNDELAAKNDATIQAVSKLIDPSLLEPVLGVRAEYLQASFDAVHDEFGDMAGYLEDGVHVDDADLAALRKQLLAG
jgi:protein-tyrosine phosphatase